jgi:hypothetical protein
VKVGLAVDGNLTAFRSKHWRDSLNAKIEFLVSVLDEFDAQKTAARAARRTTSQALRPQQTASGRAAAAATEAEIGGRAAVDCKFLVFSDVDVQFFPGRRKQWRALLNSFEASAHEVWFSQNVPDVEINSGFFIMKRCAIHRLSSFFRDVLDILQTSHLESLKFGDQTVINCMRETILSGMIPSKYTIFGDRLMADHKETAVLHHAASFPSNMKLQHMKDVREMITST